MSNIVSKYNTSFPKNQESDGCNTAGKLDFERRGRGNDAVDRFLDVLFPPKRVERRTQTLPVLELGHYSTGRNAGMIRIKDYLVKNPKTGELKPLAITKMTLASVLGLRDPLYINFDKKDDTDREHLFQSYLMDKKLIPFGSAIKGDKKGRSKFYAYELEYARKVIGNKASNLAHFPKFFMDVIEVDVFNVLSISYEELTEKVGYDMGIDGNGFIRPSASLGLPQKAAVPLYQLHKHESLTLAKGGLDDQRFTDEEFNTLFGYDIDVVMILGDEIKLNYENLPRECLWIIGFTANKDRQYEAGIQWEFTQFFKKRGIPKLIALLEKKMRLNAEEIYRIFSSKELLMEYLGKKIQTATDENPMEIETKLLMCLASDLPEDFVWTVKTLMEYCCRELGNMVITYGVTMYGHMLWIDNKMYKTSLRYLPKEIADAINADTDCDLIWTLVNNELGYIIVLRYPMVNGFAIYKIPEALKGTIPDSHPDLVKLYIEDGYRLNFNRGMIEKKKIDKPIEYGVKLAADLANNISVGANTIMLKRLSCKYQQTEEQIYLDAMNAAGLNTEVHLMGAKYITKAVPMPKLPEGELDKEFPLDFRSFNPKKRSDFEVTFEGTDVDSQLYNIGCRIALEYIDKLHQSVTRPNEIMIDTSVVMHEKITAAFMLKAKDAINYWNNEVRKLSENRREQIGAGKYKEAEEDFSWGITKVVKATEAIGEQMTIGELVATISLSYRKAGPDNTGAFGIHLANKRIMEVFGKCYKNVVPAEKKESGKKVLPIRVWSGKTYAVDSLYANRDKFSLVDGEVVYDGKPFRYGDAQPFSKEVLQDVRSFKVSLVSAYRKKDGSYSDKSFSLTCELEY